MQMLGTALGLATLAVATMIVARWARAHRRRLVHQATMAERRRIARDLHDGLAQELAFIAGRTRVLERRPADAASLAMLASAADRALDASRAAIQELRAPSVDPLTERLAGHAREIAERSGLAFRTGDLLPLEIGEEHERSVIAVVREAATNAVRHAQASTLTFEVARHGAELRVVVADDGRGLPADGGDGPGFGRISMADRAEALGGRVRFSGAPGAGTRVELCLRDAPCAGRPARIAAPRLRGHVAVRAARTAA
jgi:signal transduction histidine kinase